MFFYLQGIVGVQEAYDPPSATWGGKVYFATSLSDYLIPT